MSELMMDSKEDIFWRRSWREGDGGCVDCMFGCRWVGVCYLWVKEVVSILLLFN